MLFRLVNGIQVKIEVGGQPKRYESSIPNQLLRFYKQLIEESKLITAHAIKARSLGEDEAHKTLKDIIT
ncbi:hypothetical protein [Confluentibacter lentus]|uniref:hypothetical protein n=1 Tax=Confluentibacter lentus TaxID=1699412 RepID=UPI000C295459|nr:hypothetical protein [Confluentibacter lentus]